MSFSAPEKHRLRRISYGCGFFLNVAVAVAAYVNSSFIEDFVGEQAVGLVYIIIAVVSIIVSFNADALIKKIGNRVAIIIMALGNLLALAGLVWSERTPLIVAFFLAYSVLNFLLAINLDLYLEDISDDRTTGKIRGVFLTLANLAWLSSPLIAGLLITLHGYSAVYLVSGLAFIPLLLLAIFGLKNVPPAHYERAGIIPTLLRLWRGKTALDRDLRHIIELDFLLNFFYAVMVVYLPIYLHQHIGLQWNQIGIVFTIMLVPFVVLDFILGYLADSRWGEKELMISGLIITGLATLIIPFYLGQSILIWGAILFATRVGAATWEMMKEAYLFKKIDGRDIDLVFISRNTVPLGLLAATLLATIWLAILPFANLFLLLGLITLCGLPTALALRDTR